MERVELQAETRTVTGKKVRQVRAQNQIPAVLYGPDTKTQAIQIDERILARALTEAGSTTLIDLKVGKTAKPQVVLAREIQRDALTGRLQHVDFYQVRLTEKVKTTPRVEFVGESPAVKSGKAVLIHGMNEVEVECLPTDLIHSIEVDISGLESLDDNILVGDLPVPPSVTILADPGEVVVSLVPTRAAVEAEAEEGAEAALAGGGGMPAGEENPWDED